MNDQGRKKKSFLPHYERNRNFTEVRNFPRKRKYEDEEPVTINKKPHLSEEKGKGSNYQQNSKPQRTSPDYQYNSQQPKRYSANNRLRIIRKSFVEEQSETTVQNESNRVKSPGINIQVQFSPKASGRKSFVVTAKPSSLKERLENIRKSGDTSESSSGTDRSYKIKTPEASSPIITGQQNTTKFSPPKRSTPEFRPRKNILFQGKKRSTNTRSNSSPESIVQLPDFHQNTVATRVSANAKTNNNNINMDDNAMDWSYSEEREILLNLQELRKETTSKGETTPQTPLQQIVAQNSQDIPENKTILKDVYIIVDTNIFISHLNIVKELLKIKINVVGVVSPIVFIPWMVIQELDYIKDGRSDNKLRSKAQTAIHFINDNLLCRNSQLKGQSVREAAQQNFQSKNADDGILYCCMQISEKHNRPMLLSNDANLRNKALICGVAAYNHTEIIHALDPFRNPDWKSSKIDEASRNKLKQLQNPLNELLSDLMLQELKDAYGIAWNKIQSSIRSLPWNLRDCVEIFQRFWQPVFSMHLQKQCAMKVEKLGELLKEIDKGNCKEQDVEKCVDLCTEICVFLRNGFARHLLKIDECINSIQNIADTFTE